MSGWVKNSPVPGQLFCSAERLWQFFDALSDLFWQNVAVPTTRPRI
jgi:hypothetical protein